MEELKLCSKCYQYKPLTEFRRETDSYMHDGLFSYCRECQSAVAKERYEKNKKFYIKGVREWQKQNRANVSEYKKRYREKKKLELKSEKCNIDESEKEI